MDADSIQREARESMTLPSSEIDAINMRLVKHMQRRNFNVPMLRLVFYPSTNEWVAVPNIHAFYSEFRHVVRFSEKKIDDAALSMAISVSRTWHVYIMGMLSYLKTRGFVWIATRARLVLTPYAKGETAATVAAASLISKLLDPASKPPPISSKGEVRLRKCDVEVFEFLIRVDLGLSHLNTLIMDSIHGKKDTRADDDDDGDVLLESDSDIDNDADDVPYTIGHEGEEQKGWSPLSRGHAKSLPLLPSMSTSRDEMPLESARAETPRSPPPAKMSEPVPEPAATAPSSTSASASHHIRSMSMPMQLSSISENPTREQSEKKPSVSPRQTGQSYVQVRRAGSGTTASGGKKPSVSQKPKSKKTSDNLEFLAITKNISKKHGNINSEETDDGQ